MAGTFYPYCDPVARTNKEVTMNLQPHQNAAIRIAIELDLFSLISKSQSGGISAAELATATKADKELISMLATAILIVSEVLMCD